MARCRQCGADAGFMSFVCRKCVSQEIAERTQGQGGAIQGSHAHDAQLAYVDEPATPRAFLQQLRTQSCYSNLRSLVETIFVLNLLGIIGSGLLWFGLGSHGGSILPALVGIGVVASGLFVAVAFKEGLLLLVDIADHLAVMNVRRTAKQPADAA